MSGSQIAAEIAAGLKEAADGLSDGDFSIILVQDAPQPENPWDSPAGDETRTEIIGIIDNYERREIDGTHIRAEDRKFILSATGPRPTTADRLEVGELSYSIVYVKEEAAGGIPLVYEVQARR